MYGRGQRQDGMIGRLPRFCRFGDNMRQVAVTEGDKVEAEIKFGYSVNGYGMGDLVKVITEVSDADINRLVSEYEEKYNVSPALRKAADKHSSLREAARQEIGLLNFLKQGNFKGF